MSCCLKHSAELLKTRSSECFSTRIRCNAKLERKIFTSFRESEREIRLEKRENIIIINSFAYFLYVHIEISHLGVFIFLNIYIYIYI